MGCTGGLIEGGVFKSSAFIDADISNARITASSFSAGTIDTLVDIDDASVKTIITRLMANPDNMELFVQKMINLPDDVLRPLFNRLQKFYTADNDVSMAQRPPTEEVTDYLPTTVVGDASKVLGRPHGWMQVGTNLVTPVYDSGCP